MRAARPSGGLRGTYTPPFQLLAHGGEGAAEQHAQGAGRLARDGADLLVGEAVHETQADDELLIRLEQGDGAADLVAGVGGEGAALRVVAAAVARVALDADQLAATAAVVVDDEVVGDGEQPGDEGAALHRFVAVDRLPGAEEGLGGEVLGQPLVADAGAEVPVDA